MVKQRCQCCKKKLGMMSFDCKCNNKFCLNCQLPEKHNCNYDYNTSSKELLKETLITIRPKKLEKI